MDATSVALLRDLLDSTAWLDRTRDFSRALAGSTRNVGELLLVGTPNEEPWHLAAHLDDESRYAGLPQMSPTLVRWAPPANAPAHLAIGLERIENARRGETLFVVAPEVAPDALLERVSDARRIGATVFAMDAGDRELESLAHETLVVPSEGLLTVETHEAFLRAYQTDESDVSGMSFDTAQHLVSMAVGESAAASSSSRRTLRERLARAIDSITG